MFHDFELSSQYMMCQNELTGWYHVAPYFARSKPESIVIFHFQIHTGEVQDCSISVESSIGD